jgi:hypothetical protein
MPARPKLELSVMRAHIVLDIVIADYKLTERHG